ncbi:MAG: hypothetical protein IPK16_03995 [Anaerolineales bacterium]|nr:hypothetical protein [Anaerolineales bacterium]
MTQATTPGNGETPGSPDLDSPAIGQPVDMDRIHVAAETLQEPNVDLLAAVAREIGMDRFEGLLQETLAIEAADGMMLGDGSRRRTPVGSSFFSPARR